LKERIGGDLLEPVIQDFWIDWLPEKLDTTVPEHHGNGGQKGSLGADGTILAIIHAIVFLSPSFVTLV